MSERPILILQMQRMGDLVLTFPLILLLRNQFPETPIWVVAEESFYTGLMPLAPNVTFFPPSMAQQLATQPYQLVINLSHRPEAAQIASTLTADEIIGPVLGANDSVHIRGEWQVYRASLTHNNRHNRFHWAELNALDVIPAHAIATSRWLPPHTTQEDQSRIGLFIAASEKDKRPDTDFWCDLARALLKRGYKPVLLGGPDDIELGQEIARKGELHALNLCGRFSLEELCHFISSLRLLITPDTGPMHVAAWARTPVLNLSMGPVQPWETGPYQPEQHVLCSTISCAGCWKCKHSKVLCKASFKADRVAALSHSLIKNGAQAGQKLRIPGLQLWRSGRGINGCYALHSNTPPRSKELLANFWQEFFLSLLPLHQDSPPQPPSVQLSPVWKTYQTSAPHMQYCVEKALAALGHELALAIRKSGGSTLNKSFWASHPPFIRPLTGYIHMILQNTGYHRSSYLRCLSMIEELAAVITSQ